MISIIFTKFGSASNVRMGMPSQYPNSLQSVRSTLLRELILMDCLKKIDLTVKRVQKNWSPFYIFFQISSKMVHKTWPVSFALIQPLNISLQTPYEHEKFWGKNRLKHKKGLMFCTFCQSSLIFSKMNSFFLRCNQCIKTLHLSYQTALSDDFPFPL